MPLGAYIYSQIIGTINNKIIILLDIKRKRKNKNMATQVKTQDMLDQLHLDVSEFGTIESLINFAQDYIVNTTDSKSSLDEIIAKTNASIVNMAIKAITESLYFGNAETDGFGVRSLVLLNSIRNLYQGA